MTDDMNEKLLQEYLEGRSPVSDAYQAAEKSGPPPELDRAVLAEARAAARAGRDIGSPRWQAWLMPVSLAATVTLCIALVAEVIVFDPLLKTADSPQTFSDTFEAEADASTASPVTAGRQSPVQEMLEQKPQRPADAMDAKQERVNTNYEVETAATSFSTSVQPATVAVELAPPAEDSPESTRESDLDAGGATSAGSMGGQVSSAFVVTARSRTDTPAWPAPDVWLAGIRFLLELGELERVEAELDKFREHYPDYPLGELVQGTDED